ncbi:MAG: type I DNA topoisomerase [Patescibacteria group bacterium]|nr:type I DNA topoisomerase [Patescibacteria group bacterium]
MSLIIVESPTKARTFNRIFQGKDFFVFATMGHFRDLPKEKLAIDYQNNFKPEYQISSSKKKVVEKIIQLAKENKEIIIATDPDREGESIGYHVAFVLNKINENWPEINFKDNHLKRIVFHEITEKAINDALANPQKIRLDLVKAQISRRILDRIVGYELSPLLWNKIGKNWLSAGRVQTVALRLVVEREKEINNFEKEDYYQIYGFFDFDENLKTKLISKNEKNYEQKINLNLFAGNYQYIKTSINEQNLNLLKNNILNDEFFIENIEETITKRFPPPPFTTSLLQQEAFNRFGFSSKMTMNLAQSLYENGLITYHRTDSFNLSTYFVFKARDYIKEKYGEKYLPEKPRSYKTKSRLAQEAHEAIRPTNFNKNQKLEKMSSNHKKLYQLIFNRALATQMKEAEFKVLTIKIKSKKGYLFEGKKEKIIFDGFLKLYKEYEKNNQNFDFKVKTGDKVNLISLTEEKNTTNPPPRYTEALLIKTLEEKGIGRPSTYASIISLIQNKNYLEKEGRYFLPNPLGTAISDYLSLKFPKIFSLDFTALMEDDLDKIAQGEKIPVDVLNEFYLPFNNLLKSAKFDNEKIEIQEREIGICPECQGKLIIKTSKFGKFIACSNYPKCRYTKPILKTIANKKCPKCNGDIVIKYTKSKKKFFGCINYPKCNFSSWSLKEI